MLRFGKIQKLLFNNLCALASRPAAFRMETRYQTTIRSGRHYLRIEAYASEDRKCYGLFGNKELYVRPDLTMLIGVSRNLSAGML